MSKTIVIFTSVLEIAKKIIFFPDVDFLSLT